jgi:Ser/Thr protein kinase RdoA (MazF antagonist)
LGLPLAKLSPEQLDALNALLRMTLAKLTVWEHVRQHLELFYNCERGQGDVCAQMLLCF